jgi:hypothetical protein
MQLLPHSTSRRLPACEKHKHPTIKKCLLSWMLQSKRVLCDACR